uniref:Uncharacterized protein n=1 Tax=Anopheles darlingi TaxID=43151 RepID=A0A2M4CWV6_ANODA
MFAFFYAGKYYDALLTHTHTYTPVLQSSSWHATLGTACLSSAMCFTFISRHIYTPRCPLFSRHNFTHLTAQRLASALVRSLAQGQCREK